MLKPYDPNKTIMVIEDNPVTLYEIRDYLCDKGYKVIPCKQTFEAITLLNEITPSLIILDIVLPEMDGFEFCKQIKSNERTKMVPIVFLTALTELQDKLEGFKLGGDDYITKPFSMEELLARVEAILQRMEKCYAMSMRDELTDAYNRRYFNERLELELYQVKRTGRPFSVVLLDIDFFKKITDSYGYRAGDFILNQLVCFLKQRLRKTDLVFRIDGEAFVLLLSETKPDQAFILVERLRQELLATTLQYEENGVATEIKLTFCAGIASCPGHSEMADDLLAKADTALYQAKHAGGNITKIAESVF